MLGRIQTILLAIGGAVIFILTFGQIKKREGAKTERSRAKEADYENAADIHDRVDRNRDQRVREMEGRGWRD